MDQYHHQKTWRDWSGHPLVVLIASISALTAAIAASIGVFDRERVTKSGSDSPSSEITESSSSYSIEAIVDEADSLRDSGSFNKAIGLYDEVIEIDPSNIDAWYGKASAWARSGDRVRAVNSLEEVVLLDRNHNPAWQNMGLLYQEAGRYEEAVKAHKVACEIEDQYNEIDCSNLGTALADLEQYEEAVSAYDKALRINPQHFTAWHNLSSVYNDMGEYRQAIEAANQAIRLDKNKQNIGGPWLSKGRALYHLGKYEEALASYEKALELDPDNSTAIKNIRYLKKKL